MKCIYLIGSLRNPEVPKLGIYLRGFGFEVFDEWYSAGPIADDSWMEHQKQKGISYRDALQGYAARNVFNFDHYHLDRADIGVLVMPAGKSGHLEFGYLMGQDKPGYILFDKEPERWDVMYQFADDICWNKEELIRYLRKHKK